MELYNENDVVVEVKEGDIVITHDSKAINSVNKVKLEYLFSKLKEAIPGQVDDIVLDTLLAALKNL